MGDAVGSQITWGVVAVWLIQKLKKAKCCPFINDHSDGLNMFLSSVAALLAAAGVHFAFDTQSGVVTITGLTLMNASHFMADFLKSVVAQEMTYRVAFKNGKSKNGDSADAHGDPGHTPIKDPQ